MKTLIKVAILLVLVLCGGAFYGWQKFKPIAAELISKDEEKYNLMISEAKSFSFGTAQKVYEELDAMTPEDVISLRHRKWQERLESDEEFRNSYIEEQYKLRELESVERKSRYALKLQTLIFKPDQKKLLNTNWKNSEPWQKVIILRQKCIKYLKTEETDSRLRTNVLEPSRTASILDRPRNLACGEKMADICLAISISEYCMNLIPNTDDNETVLQAMQRLRKRINHYYYVKILDEIGISREGSEFDQQLQGLSEYFTDS